MSLIEIQRICASPASPSAIFLQEGVGRVSKRSGSFCNLQFAINTSKPPAPVALQGRLCLSGKPHEYKRSLVWLNLPYPTKLGKPRVRRPPLSISILQRRQGTLPSNLPPPIKFPLSIKKKKWICERHWRSRKNSSLVVGKGQ